MSLQQIKQKLETYLNDNYPTQAIKWPNTDIITLNKTVLTQTQIDNLTDFIEPSIIPVSSGREYFSTVSGIKWECFFQVLLYTRKGTGTGSLYEMAEEIDGLFREKTINDVICDRVDYLPSFELGDWEVLTVSIHAWTY